MAGLSNEYFEDQIKITRIEQSILDALPDDEYYHIIVLAVQRVLQSLVEYWAREEIGDRWKKS